MDFPLIAMGIFYLEFTGKKPQFYSSLAPLGFGFIFFFNIGFNYPIYSCQKADDNMITLVGDSPYQKLQLKFECCSLGEIVLQTKEQLQIVIKLFQIFR